MISDQPVTASPLNAPPADEAAAAAEQMLAATEKLRAKLPMMKGDPVPQQSTEP